MYDSIAIQLNTGTDPGIPEREDPLPGSATEIQHGSEHFGLIPRRQDLGLFRKKVVSLTRSNSRRSN